MDWIYTGNDKLARAATKLYEQRSQPCRVSPYVFMSDPERTPDLLKIAQQLPEGAALIYRHFGAKNRKSIARKLRRISYEREIQLLIGQDIGLAMDVGADGVHFAERDLAKGRALHEEYPEVLITGAAHSLDAVHMCVQNGFDAAIVSPVFKSDSPSAGAPLGIEAFIYLRRTVDIPLIALGGINPRNISALLGSGASGIAGVSGFSCDDNV